MTIDAARLRSILHYDPLTGTWTWIACGKPQHNGKRADCFRDKKKTYRIVTIDRKKYYAHRLAWLYMTGDWPDGDLDHKDLNKSNNIWDNLRPTTDSLNNANKPAAVRAVPKGVDKTRWGYQARIKVNLKSIHLGTYKTADEARAAYIAAAEKYFGEHARVS